jgi:antiviral helicase SKI2
MSHPGF